MNKRYLKNVGIYIISAILSILLIAYIIYHLVLSFSDDIETMAADVVTVSETYNAEAYIFRNENLLYASSPGNANYLFEDGTMVRRGAAVANIYSSGNTDELKNQISDIERKISILESSSLAKDVTLSDSSSLDSQIENLYYSLQNKKNTDDIDYVFRRKDELLTLLNKRQLVLKVVDGFDGQIATLQGEKNSIASTMGGIAQTVYTDTSGYLYSDVDGYESIFTADAVDTFGFDDFNNMISSTPDSAAAGAIGKIATDYKWYIACEMPSVQQQYYTEGANYDVNFPYSGGTVIPMTLHRIVTSGSSDSIILVFSTGNIPKGFNFLRKQSVEIVQQSYTGYRIPVSAVRIVDGVQGVYVKRGSVVLFKEIKPQVEIDGYFIVEEQDKLNDENYADKLGMYDLVITKGKNLYENKVIQ